MTDKKQNPITKKVEVKTKQGLKGFGNIVSNMFNIFTGGMLRGKKQNE